jgi:solute:Na+ symporter, SSS family
LLEYPIMAFMGVILGLFARAAAESGMFEGIAMGGAASLDAELGLPMLLSHILPIGFLGLMLSAYFSAIMSTADSCLLAASGNLISDLFKMNPNHPKGMRYAQWSTFLIGAVAIGIAASLQSVLELMLLSYAFMVAGMLIPVLVIVFKIKANENAAFYSMLIGGGSTVALYLFNIQLPYQLDPIVLGLICSAALYSFLLKTSS